MDFLGSRQQVGEADFIEVKSRCVEFAFGNLWRCWRTANGNLRLVRVPHG